MLDFGYDADNYKLAQPISNRTDLAGPDLPVYVYFFVVIVALADKKDSGQLFPAKTGKTRLKHIIITPQSDTKYHRLLHSAGRSGHVCPSRAGYSHGTGWYRNHEVSRKIQTRTLVNQQKWRFTSS